MGVSRCSRAGISPVHTDAPNVAPEPAGEWCRNLPQFDADFDPHVLTSSLLIMAKIRHEIGRICMEKYGMLS